MNDTVDGDVLASFIQDIANPDEVSIERERGEERDDYRWKTTWWDISERASK